MVRVTVEIETPGSIDFVRNWWLDYGEGDANLTGDILARTALWVDKTTAELRTTTRFAGRTVRSDGTVHVLARNRWRFEGVIHLHEEPFATVRTDFQLDDLHDRRRLTARFEFRGVGFGPKVILPFVRPLIRQGLVREYDEFRRAIESEWNRGNG